MTPGILPVKSVCNKDEKIESINSFFLLCNTAPLTAVQDHLLAMPILQRLAVTIDGNTANMCK